MAISSTTVNDLAAGTSTLKRLSGSTVENIVYTQSTNAFVFSSESSFSLSATDYVKFFSILDVYNKNILFVFTPAVNAYASFNISQVSDTDDGINALAFTFYKRGHLLYDISATYPSGTVNFAARTQGSTVLFDEFEYFLAISAFFTQQLRLKFKV